MFGDRAFGTRNSASVATAQHEDKNLLAGLSKPLERFTKKEAGVHSVEFFDLMETSIGTVQAQFGIDGKDIRLNISPLQGVGHTVGEGDKAFFKVESTHCIKNFSYEAEECTVTVPKEDVKYVLRGLEFGTPVSVEMDNGYVFEGKVCDINRTDRFQFFKLIEAMGEKLGLTVGRVQVGDHVEKAILRDGTPVTSNELLSIFDEKGHGALVKCAFSTNNLTGKVSLYDIGIPGDQA